MSRRNNPTQEQKISLIDAYLADPWKLASNGELEDLKKLIDNGVPFDNRDEGGFTPITWAARNGHTHVLSYLIELNCSMSTSSFGGKYFNNYIYFC